MKVTVSSSRRAVTSPAGAVGGGDSVYSDSKRRTTSTARPCPYHQEVTGAVLTAVDVISVCVSGY